MSPRIWLKALPLFGFSFVEIAVSFVRALVLTRFLGPYEFGFASAISLTFATAVLVTDMGVHRFVLSTRRTEFAEAIAGAHAITLLRSFLIALGVLIASFPLSCTFASCSDWTSFAWLAPIMLIASLEHLEIRISERDYRYWPQFTASLVSHGLGLIALALTAYKTENHYAFLSYLFVQVIVYVLLSHLLASNPYQAKFKSPYFRRASKFGFPLLINGIGLAIIGQGDRFMIGALAGLETLGIYTILLLAAVVPISALLKILNPILFAGLHNARDKNQYATRLRLFTGAIPIIAGCYALALIGLLKLVLPIVFGPQYAISDQVAGLLAFIAFVRIARIEPGTSLLLQTHNTGKLAIANLSLAVGLFTATALVVIYRSIEAALIGALVGELVGLCVMIFITKSKLKTATINYAISFVVTLMVVVFAYSLVTSAAFSDAPLYRVAVAGALLILLIAAAAVFLSGPFRRAYNPRERVATFELRASKVADINAQLPKTTDGSWN